MRASRKVVTMLGLDTLSWSTALCPFTDAKGKRTPELHSLAAQIQSPDMTSNDLSTPEVRHALPRCKVIETTNCIILEVLGGLNSVWICSVPEAPPCTVYPHHLQ